MVRPELKPIDVGNTPELLRIAQEVKTTRQPYVLKVEDEELAVIRPLQPMPRPRKSGLVSKDDSLWNIVAIGKSDGPTDISQNKHKYLAEAYGANSR